jgi:Flp pilus assembly pilin Flp
VTSGFAPNSIGSPSLASTDFGTPPGGPEKRREVTKTMTRFFAFIDSLFKREEGQTMAEYGVVLAVITLAVIAAITLLSENVRDAITNVANILP